MGRRLTRRKSRGRGKSRSRRQGGSGKNLEIQYLAGKVSGQIFPVSQTQQKPSISIPEGHYVVMYDPDAGNPVWIHWIVTKGGDVLPYQGPSPPAGTGLHRYIFVLVAGNPPPMPLERGGQDVEALAPPAKRVAAAFFLTGKN
jgi:phosphatidylethanolamine-binding protein (PEBP) family uncharacterized protein